MTPVPLTSELIRGTAELESTARGLRPHRLPGWVRAQFPDPQLSMMEAQPSGVRIAFTTEARQLELRLHPTRIVYRGTDRARGCVDVLIDGQLHQRDQLDGGDRVELDFTPGVEPSLTPGRAHTSNIALPAGEKSVEVWLPHNESIEVVGLRSDHPVHPIKDHQRLWVHHGSSISHGSAATAPSETWPAVTARTTGLELRNLGFGGSAMVDPFMARVIRDAPADLISVKLGINVVNVDAMRMRSFVPAVHGFLDTIRDGHPDTPLLVITPLYCPIHERTPGPGAVDPNTLGTDQVKFVATGDPDEVAAGKLALETIRSALTEIVEQRRGSDPTLHLMDGTELYGATDAINYPLPDGLHPDPQTHRKIGERFSARLFGSTGVFGRR